MTFFFESSRLLKFYYKYCLLFQSTFSHIKPLYWTPDLLKILDTLLFDLRSFSHWNLLCFIWILCVYPVHFLLLSIWLKKIFFKLMEVDGLHSQSLEIRFSYIVDISHVCLIEFVFLKVLTCIYVLEISISSGIIFHSTIYIFYIIADSFIHRSYYII